MITSSTAMTCSMSSSEVEFWAKIANNVVTPPDQMIQKRQNKEIKYFEKMEGKGMNSCLCDKSKCHRNCCLHKI